MINIRKNKKQFEGFQPVDMKLIRAFKGGDGEGGGTGGGEGGGDGGSNPPPPGV